MPNLTTVAEWAKSLGISRQQGYAAVTRCGITVADGKVDSEYATILYHRHTRVRAGASARDVQAAPEGDKPAGQGASEYSKQRARREAAEAEIAEMKAAEMSGKYLVKDEVAAAVFQMSRALRDGLTNCARRIAADVAGLASADDCEVVIDREHRELLENLAQAAEAELGVASGSADQ